MTIKVLNFLRTKELQKLFCVFVEICWSFMNVKNVPFLERKLIKFEIRKWRQVSNFLVRLSAVLCLHWLHSVTLWLILQLLYYCTEFSPGQIDCIKNMSLIFKNLDYLKKSFLKLEKLFVCSFFHKWAIYVNKKQNRKFSSLISISKFNHLKVPNSGVSGFLGAKSCCTAAVVLHQTEQRARCARWCSKKEN